MEVIFLLTLAVSGLCLVHTYWFYPKLIQWLVAKKSWEQPPPFFRKAPSVSVLMAVYNEEKVIAQKIETLLQQDYPAERIRIFIGSDNSSDGTNRILKNYAQQHHRIQFFSYRERHGKPGIINHLYDIAVRAEPVSPDHLFLITDANVMLAPGCLRAQVRHFADPQVAIVDAHMQHVGLQARGISRSEDQYLSGEVMLKHREGKLWGTMIGPFGGCYVLRSNYFSRVPPNFLVDDFYIAMRVFERGGKVINDLDAICYEAVSHDWREEYRRKARISTGNYQNLVTFRHLWWPPFRPLNFAFFSHKVLRWLAPFFLILFFISSLALATLFFNYWYTWLFLLVIVFYFALPILDVIVRRWGIQWRFIRNIRYFFLMNLALLTGFFRFIKGVKNNVWEPPKRQQLPS